MYYYSHRTKHAGVINNINNCTILFKCECVFPTVTWEADWEVFSAVNV